MNSIAILVLVYTLPGLPAPAIECLPTLAADPTPIVLQASGDTWAPFSGPLADRVRLIEYCAARLSLPTDPAVPDTVGVRGHPDRY